MKNGGLSVTFAGNPNVGKSTLFNALTGLKQHTGNWCGKTVGCAEGEYTDGERKIMLTDLPGIYSLSSRSAEEEAARDYLMSHRGDTVVYVIGASSLERGLMLFLAVRRICKSIILCVNLIDEAAEMGIVVDEERLSEMLGCPVVMTSARNGEGIDALRCAIAKYAVADTSVETVEDNPATAQNEARIKDSEVCRNIARECLVVSGGGYASSKERKIDRIVCGKYTAYPVMLCLALVVLWLTVYLSTYLSEGLEYLCGKVTEVLYYLCESVKMPQLMQSFVISGVAGTVFKVISVMLPPMAIFFPLFTLLEDVGYLPRAAFVLDRVFEKCGVCGKQSLTMLMGLGCNSVGVVGCRIIDSPRERRIAMITNSLTPCNGRLPIIIACAGIMCSSTVSAGLCILAALLIGVAASLALSKALSLTIFRGEPSSYTLELPPYRIPKAGEVIVRSVLDRVVKVMGRAVTAAAPCGALIWLVNNIEIGGGTLFSLIAGYLDGIGRFLGMDGVILLSFILAFPAAELMLPVMLSAGDIFAGEAMTAAEYFASAGIGKAGIWCVMLFTLMHFPCATTLMTIRRESGRWGDVALAAVLPLLLGVMLCTVVGGVF